MDEVEGEQVATVSRLVFVFVLSIIIFSSFILSYCKAFVIVDGRPEMVARSVEELEILLRDVPNSDERVGIDKDDDNHCPPAH